MSKFDTHGGYFAPKDYLRVNEGGSHEENPNGGVQIGVDPEGNPNLLEEGEPVYKDYVYSDNITAEKEFLEQNHLPGKYDGKLYSKIADDILTEAEERPLDPISRNGLEALLGRLAEAQEGQKRRDERVAFEDELANMSPEELDQLEAMIVQGEQEPVQPEMMAPEMQQPVEEVPMMGCGGTMLHKYEAGGPKKSMADEVRDEILAQAGVEPRASGIGNTDYPLISEHPDLDLALMFAQPGSLLTKALAPSAYRGIVNGVSEGEGAQALMPMMGKAKIAKSAVSAADAANISGKIADYGKEISAAKDELVSLKKELDLVKKGGPGSRDVIKSNIEKANERIRFAKQEIRHLESQLPETEKIAKAAESAEKKTKSSSSSVKERSAVGHVLRTAVDPFYVGKNIWNNTAGSGWRLPATIGGGFVGAIPATGFWTGLGKSAEALIDSYSTPAGVSSEGVTPYTGYYSDETPEDLNFDSEPQNYGPTSDIPELISLANGGKINKFELGGDAEDVIDPRELVPTPDNAWSYWMPYTGLGGINSTAGVGYSSNPAGTNRYYIPYSRDINGNDFESQDYYQNFLAHMLQVKGSDEANDWMKYIQDEIAKKNSKYKLRDFDDWYRLATDKKVGPVHQATEAVAKALAQRQNMRANKVSIDDALRNNNLAGVADPNAVGLRLPGTLMYQLNPSQAMAARELSKRAAVAGAMDTLGIPGTGSMTMTAVGQNLTANTSEPEVKNVDVKSSGNNDTGSYNERITPETLPTWPRYAGAIGSGLLGLYNTFTPADKYTQRRLTPQLPEGRIHLQNQVYNPVDQNMIMNAQIAQGNATNRALRNSGLGPSSAAAILAADNNTTGNLGTGFIQAWDSNNQRRNAVIAANNQAEAQRANFDWTVDAARKQILNDAAYKNAYNDLMLQRLNYAAEGDKYQAISNQIANGLQALSGIGQENFAMNQVNTNPAYLGYRVGPNGQMVYAPWYSNCGGFLKKYKK